ncbi:hypothetical protein ACJIZ3_001770 [Penstemon smallii]|uniref:Uncharacterized protein n=1 Tax=Penstemon smallii TaxID=265156 RepID=A0ABD3U4M8_9LAMI
MAEFEVESPRRNRKLLRPGGDRDDRGWTMLHIHAQKGDLREVKRLLDEGMNANVAAIGPKSHGVTPLHLAAKGGYISKLWMKKKAISFLVENGAFLPDDINDTRFNPPLHYCPGLEWAYEEMRHLHTDSSSPGETSCSSDE